MLLGSVTDRAGVAELHELLGDMQAISRRKGKKTAGHPSG